jgi:hypothetical protein
MVLVIPGVLLVGGVAVSGYVFWRNWRANREDAGSSDAGGKGAPSQIPGVNILPGVVLTDPVLEFLPKLRKLLGFDFTITSAFRSAADQARVMNDNYEAHGGSSGGGRAYLESLYSYGTKAADALQSGGVAALTALVAQRVADGDTNGHLGGRGLDFRISDLTGEQIAALKAAGSELGVNVLDEGNHVHMDHIGLATALLTEQAKGASKFARKTLPILLATGAGVTMIGGVWWMARRRGGR